jgi:hypothetical protein
MTGENFIRLAGQLVARPNADEAACRTAISRAYYGAYHLARGVLRSIGFEVSDHGLVRFCLFESGQPAGIELARDLGLLQNLRIKADYDLHDGDAGNAVTARLAVERGHEAISNVGLLTNPSVLGNLKDGVEQYLKKRRGRSGSS